MEDLCGPNVFADPATKTIATNQPAPEGARPGVLGFANNAIDWGGARRTTISWPFLAVMQDGQGQVMIHELFHRIQPQLGLFVPERAAIGRRGMESAGPGPWLAGRDTPFI